MTRRPSRPPGTDPPARQRRTTVYLIDQVLLPKN
jgi:hypothetical protein